MRGRPVEGGGGGGHRRLTQDEPNQRTLSMTGTWPAHKISQPALC